MGSDEEISIKDLALKVIEVTGSKSALVFAPPLKDGDMTRRKPDNQKMKGILGRSLISLEDGLRRTLENRLF